MGLATGASHVCALLGDGGVRCWGSNGRGQLGDGTTTNRPAPVPVVGLTGAVALAAGLGHTCAILDDGTARCWGGNDQGQLGIGILGDISVPVSPLNLTSAVAIATGGGHTCARLASGQVRCWGDNGVHQASHLDGDQLSPVTVALASLQPLQSVVALATGSFHTCALQSNGSPYCWGSNSSGTLGNGTTTGGQFPTEVPSFRFNIAASVELTGQGRVARVTALVNCPEGAQVKVRISVTQGPAAGEGNGLGKCTGALEAYPVTVPAHGRYRFEPGPAVAEADADVRSRGTLVETQEWSRGVQLVVEP